MHRGGLSYASVRSCPYLSFGSAYPLHQLMAKNMVAENPDRRVSLRALPLMWLWTSSVSKEIDQA